MAESAKEVYGSVKVKDQRVCGGTVREKLRLVERKLLGRCWHLAMKTQKKDLWRLTERKRERLKGAYIRVKRK